MNIKPTDFWIELSLPVTDETEEVIVNFLFELGAHGCYNQNNIVRAYFRDSDWNQQQAEQLQTYLQQLAELRFPVQPGKINIRKIENQDWNLAWKQNIKPIEIGTKFIIKPGWIPLEPSSNKQIIEIDPQMAFGTGLHATTQLMLKLLIDHVGSPKLIMDMGTGTGILTIAAIRLTDSVVIAFDNDPIAAATAKENCTKNGVIEKAHIFCGTIDAIKDTHFDLILANINKTIIIESLPKIYRLLGGNGLAIFSGILIDEKEKFIYGLREFHCKILKQAQQQEWMGFVVSCDA